MNLSDARALCALIGARTDPTQTRVAEGQWLRARCPFAFATHTGGRDSNPSFAVQIRDGGRSRYHCFSCNVSGDVAGLSIEFRALAKHPRAPAIDHAKLLQLIAGQRRGPAIPAYDAPRDDDPPRVVPFRESILSGKPPAYRNPDAARYLAARCVGPTLARFLDVRYDPELGRVAFPLRDARRRLIGLHGRTIFDHPLRWYAYRDGERYNAVQWFGEWFVDASAPVLVTEAIFDVVSTMRVYRNVLSPLLAGLSQHKIARIAACDHVVTLFDKGTGGDAARRAMARHCKARTLVQLEPFGADDPGDMTVVELHRVLGAHLPLIEV